MINVLSKNILNNYNKLNFFFIDLREINTLSFKEYFTLSSFFLLSSLMDIVGLSLIGPYIQFFFLGDIAEINFFPSYISTLLDQGEFFFLITAVLILIFFLKGFFGFFIMRQIIIFSALQQASLISRLSKKLFFLKNNNLRTNYQIINDFFYNIRIYIEQTLMALLRLTAEIIICSFIVIFLLTAYFEVSVFIILFLLFLFVVYFFFVQKKIYKFGKIASSSSEQMLEMTNNVLSGFKDIVLYSKENIFFNQLKNSAFENMTSGAKANSYTQFPKYFFDALLAISFILFLYLGRNIFDKGQILIYLSVTGLAAYRLFPSIFQISVCISCLRFSRFHLSEVARLSRDLNKIKTFDNNNSINPEIKKVDSLDLKGINFTFFSDKKNVQIFNNFNFNLKKGDLLFISGNSGKGKSTLANILTGFIDVNSGDILVNTKKINNVNKFAKEFICHSSQIPFIAKGSIMQNVTMFEDNVDIKKFNQALKDSCSDEFIIKNNIDYHEIFNDLKKNFSGGELQRLQIARTLYYDKDIMIFDESTSALEPDLEEKIILNLRGRLKNKIIIFISHREMNKKYFTKFLKF